MKMLVDHLLYHINKGWPIRTETQYHIMEEIPQISNLALGNITI